MKLKDFFTRTKNKRNNQEAFHPKKRMLKEKKVSLQRILDIDEKFFKEDGSWQ